MPVEISAKDTWRYWGGQLTVLWAEWKILSRTFENVEDSWRN